MIRQDKFVDAGGKRSIPVDDSILGEGKLGSDEGGEVGESDTYDAMGAFAAGGGLPSSIAKFLGVCV